MVPTPEFEDMATFGSGSAMEEPDPTTFAGGFLPGQVLPAEYENWLLNKSTANLNTLQENLINVVDELGNVLAAASIVPDPMQDDQVIEALNALFATVASLASEVSTRAEADTTLQNNINLKADINSPTFTGTVVVPAAVGSTSPVRKAVTDDLQTQVNANNLLSVENSTFSISSNTVQQLASMAINETREVGILTSATGTFSYSLLLPSVGVFTTSFSVVQYSSSGVPIVLNARAETGRPAGDTALTGGASFTMHVNESLIGTLTVKRTA